MRAAKLSVVNMMALTMAAANEEEGVRLARVAEATGLSSAAVTGIVDRLEEAGYCVRKVGRRRVDMLLTEEGQRVLSQVGARLCAVLEAA